MGDPLEALGAWLEASWEPSMTLRAWWQRLGEAGWATPGWPVEWFGRGLEPGQAAAAARTIREHGAVPGPGGFGTGMAGPTLLVHGTDEQRARHLPGLVTGADAFCQLFSEPGAGSDLAGLRCRAERDGDTWVVNGQKVWTSGGQIANKAMLLARTNVDVPKHAGISYFFVDVTQPGVEIRPLREMTGRSFFNEVFLADVRVADDDLVGGEGNGWAVANTTLAVERGLSAGGGAGASAASPGPIAGHLDRPAADFVVRVRSDDAEPVRSRSHRLAELARRLGRDRDPLVRDALARLHSLERVNELNGARGRALAARDAALPGLPNLAKMGQNHALRAARDLTFQILGVAATVHGYSPEAVVEAELATGVDGLGELLEDALFAQGPPIYGGSDQIQRNIVGERVLGLPREPALDHGVPFRDLPR